MATVLPSTRTSKKSSSLAAFNRAAASLSPVTTRPPRPRGGGERGPFFNEHVAEDNAYGSRPAELCLCSCSHLVWLETKFPLELLERRRRPERVHADNTARPADVALPPERRGLLHRDARCHLWRQDGILILLRLLFEDVPGRHRDHARPDALSDELLVGLHSETDFTP